MKREARSTQADESIGYEQVQAIASSVGLPEIGVTSADDFPELVEHLRAYERRGRTGFEADDVQQRVSPSAFHPRAKTILVVALPYLTAGTKHTARVHPRGANHGMSSVYVYGEDYHRILHARLSELHRALEAVIKRPIDAKIAVDTSPLVDRRIAERAGLGWIGKNAMFYSYTYGSYVFLGSMLMDIDISNQQHCSEVIGKHCGTCKACMVACPTDAILSPGVIDATRCLSYVTQMKGIIPAEFRRKIGKRIWGCDICQTVCPENKVANSIVDSAFNPTMEWAYPDLLHLLSLTNRRFEREYGSSAMGWRGLRTLQRNALIVLGNMKRQESLHTVVPFLNHARAELRASAAYACGEIGGAEARDALLQALKREEDPEVRVEMENGVLMCGNH